MNVVAAAVVIVAAVVVCQLFMERLCLNATFNMKNEAPLFRRPNEPEASNSHTHTHIHADTHTHTQCLSEQFDYKSSQVEAHSNGIPKPLDGCLLIHTISPHRQSIAMMHFFHGHNPFLYKRRASRQKIGLCQILSIIEIVNTFDSFTFYPRC